MNPNPRTVSSGVASIASVAETLPSHRSASGTAFVQDKRKSAFDSTNEKELHTLIKPTTELSKRGMDRWIEKLREHEVRERNAENGLFGLFSRPLAILSPFVVAIVGKHSFYVSLYEVVVSPNSSLTKFPATVFADRLTNDKE